MVFRISRGQKAAGMLAGLALVIGGPAATARAEEPAAASAPASGGMRVGIDPQTGALIPNPPAIAAGTPSVSHSAAGLVEESAPGGGVMVDLKGRFRSAMTSEATPDGAHTSCQSGNTAATPR